MGQLSNADGLTVVSCIATRVVVVQAHCGGGAPARRKGGVKKKKSMIIYNVSHDGVYTIRGERDVASSPLGRALSILLFFYVRRVIIIIIQLCCFYSFVKESKVCTNELYSFASSLIKDRS